MPTRTTQTLSPTAVRVILAGMLGVLVGSYTGIRWPLGDGLIAVALILAPPTLSLALDAHIAQKEAAIVPLLRGLLGVLAGLGLLGVVVASPKDPGVIIATVASIYQVAAVLLVPAVAALSLGRVTAEGQPAIGLALACAASAWLGFGIRSFTQSALAGEFSGGRSSGFVVVVVLFLFGLYLLGFGLSALEGLLGISARAWLLRRAAHPARP
jgi:hypothetical protein